MSNWYQSKIKIGNDKMYKKLSVLLILMIIFSVGCSFNNQDGSYKDNALEKNKDEKSKEDLSQEEKNETEAVDPVVDEINKMTLDEKIGQLVIVGFEGYSIDEATKKMIEEYSLGGVILFGRNVENSTQLLDLINSLKKTNINNIPLFISIDEEGGIVSRMPDEFVDLPNNRIIGQRNDKDFSYHVGKVIAKEIKAFGFNMNYAPVLDIDSNPNNPVIGARAFGSNESIVSELGIATMEGMQSEGVISVVKHFPGHGDTIVDSHFGLPLIEKELDAIKQFELIPFTKAINNHCDAIMIAHILFNKIDSDNPASFSKTIITDILRNQLKFEGVVITDDLTMGAILKNYEIGEAAVKSINAGSDIVLVCHGYDNEVSVISSLKKAVQNGEISEERINESVYRILSLKKKYNINNNKIGSVDIDKINSEINSIIN